MKLLVAGVLIVAGLTGLIGVSSIDVCRCAAISKPNLEPIIVTILDSKLDCQDAPLACKGQCAKLFKPLIKSQWPNLCAGIDHLDPTKISVYSNSCNNGTWIDTGISFSNPICCHDGKEHSCIDLPPPAIKP